MLDESDADKAEFCKKMTNWIEVDLLSMLEIDDLNGQGLYMRDCFYEWERGDGIGREEEI